MKPKRLQKLDPLPEDILAKDALSVRQYLKKIKHKYSLSYVHTRIDRVLAGVIEWETFKAYRKGENIVIVEINNQPKTQLHEEKPNRKG